MLRQLGEVYAEMVAGYTALSPPSGQTDPLEEGGVQEALVAPVSILIAPVGRIFLHKLVRLPGKSTHFIPADVRTDVRNLNGIDSLFHLR